jgi:hypothetical protein
MQDIIDFIKGRLGAGRPTLSAADTKASSPSGR